MYTIRERFILKLLRDSFLNHQISRDCFLARKLILPKLASDSHLFNKIDLMLLEDMWVGIRIPKG